MLLKFNSNQQNMLFFFCFFLQAFKIVLLFTILFCKKAPKFHSYILMFCDLPIYPSLFPRPSPSFLLLAVQLRKGGGGGTVLQATGSWAWK